MNVAFIFPGQGSQYVGMGTRIADADEKARQVFEEASSVLGIDILDLCRTGPEERLNLTEMTQPAILTASIAAWEVFSRAGIRPVVMAGHSLGEYSALVAAGALSLSDAVRAVHKRGRFMQEAVPDGTGSMVAILGMERPEVEAVCGEVSSRGVVSAVNFNSPIQTVIGGEKKAVEAAAALAKERGAKRVVPLAVSVPSHCSLMAPAVERLREELNSIRFESPSVPIVTNVDAEPVISGSDARSALLRQLDSPVRWVESIERMAADGVNAFVEIGPGTVLSKLVKRISKSALILNVEDLESMETTRRALSGQGLETGGG